MSDIENQEPKSPVKSRYGRISRKPVVEQIVEKNNRKRPPKKSRDYQSDKNQKAAEIFFSRQKQKVIKERIIVDPVDSDEEENCTKPKTSHSRRKPFIAETSVKELDIFYFPPQVEDLSKKYQLIFFLQI